MCVCVWGGGGGAIINFIFYRHPPPLPSLLKIPRFAAVDGSMLPQGDVEDQLDELTKCLVKYMKDKVRNN